MTKNINTLNIKLANKEKFQITDLIIERSNRIGFIEIYPIECTKYNNYSDGRDSEIPREDGSFDVEGHNSSDVHAAWDIRWWEPRHWKTIGPSFVQYFEGVKEFVIDSFLFWIKKDVKFLFRRINEWLLVNPLKVEQTGWVWVADSLSISLKVAAYDLADDIFAIEQGFKDSTDRYRKTRKIFDHKKVQKKADELLSTKKGQAKVFKYMVEKDNLVKVTDYMWVSKNDPTCFVLDENFIPFDMKDGWSPEMLTRVIAYWFRVFYEKDLTVRIRKENE